MNASVLAQSPVSLGISPRLAEIRNPLTGLKLHRNCWRNASSEVARVAQLLTEVQRLELLVSSTRCSAASRPRMQADGAGGLIDEVADLGSSLSHRGVAVERRYDEFLHASVDAVRRQAILNLVTNCGRHALGAGY
jgi:nitrogen-specific signal transduction histidine kinase